jgi:curli biogenesis system outer membrane secretion channel CsgG
MFSTQKIYSPALTRPFFALLMGLLFLGGLPSLPAQDNALVVIPEEVKKKCKSLPFEDRVKIRVASFKRSTSGVESKDINNFSTMLSNALFELDCYRVLQMEKDAEDSGKDVERNLEKPQIVVTGEITEYSHTQKVEKIAFRTKKTTTARIGFVVQLKDPVTGELLFSKSFNQEGLSESYATEVQVNAGRLGPQTVGTSKESPIDLAYFNAIERGILDAVTFLVDSQDRINQILEGSSLTESRTVIELRKASFTDMQYIEQAAKGASGVSRVDKIMKDGVAKITVFHKGSSEELAYTLAPIIEDRLEITGLEDGKITLAAKQK